MESPETHARNQLNKMMLSKVERAEVKHLMSHYKYSSLEDLTDDEAMKLYHTSSDNLAESYAAKMREGHGIGCYCGYCCM